MDLFKLNILQSGFFKQTRFLLSSPERVTPCVFISESGTISREMLPVHVGYMKAIKQKMAWVNLHTLKIGIKDKNGVLQDQRILLITERSYIPLDPFKKLTAKNRDNLAPLKTIAKMRHAEKRANIGEGGNEDARNRMLKMATEGGLILIALMIIGKIVQCGGPG